MLITSIQMNILNFRGACGILASKIQNVHSAKRTKTTLASQASHIKHTWPSQAWARPGTTGSGDSQADRSQRTSPPMPPSLRAENHRPAPARRCVYTQQEEGTCNWDEQESYPSDEIKTCDRKMKLDYEMMPFNKQIIIWIKKYKS